MKWNNIILTYREISSSSRYLDDIAYEMACRIKTIKRESSLIAKILSGTPTKVNIMVVTLPNSDILLSLVFPEVNQIH